MNGKSLDLRLFVRCPIRGTLPSIFNITYVSDSVTGRQEQKANTKIKNIIPAPLYLVKR